MVKNPLGSIPGLGKSPGEGKEQLHTPVFLLREFHGQRNLVGYSLWGHKKSDRTEQLTLTFTSSVNGLTPLFYAKMYGGSW